MLPKIARHPNWVGAGTVIASYFLLSLAINPFHNFPMGDDWEYARTVQRLLTTGQFYRSPVVQATAFFPAVWGALFSALLGFSFTTLRLSTLPLATGTLLAFYLILDELNFEPAQRLMGTLTLSVAPLFVFNAYSFMTDVPFLFWLVFGLWCSLRAFRLGRLTWLVAGSICAAFAFLTRQMGLALPVAVSLVVLIHRPRSDWSRWLAASVAVPLIAAALFYLWETWAGQATWADATITSQGTLEFILNPQLPAAVARRIVIMLVTLNLYMLPFWLAFLPHFQQGLAALRGLSGRLRVVATGLSVFFFGSVTYFGARNDWWPYSRGSLTNAGLWPSLAFYAFPDDVRPPFFPAPVWIGMTYLGAALSIALTLNLVVRFVRALREPGEPINGIAARPRRKMGAAEGRELPSVKSELERSMPRWRVQAWRILSARLQFIGPSHALIYMSFLTMLALVLIYPLFVERYFLPFLPLAIILLLEATRQLPPAPALAGLALLAVGVFSVGLMWDYWNWHAARWTQAQALVAAGLPLEKLDAGYEWSGWYLSDEAYAYIRAKKLPLTANPVQYVIDPEYMITFTRQPGYRVARELPFFNPFRPGGRDKILLLEREGDS